MKTSPLIRYYYRRPIPELVALLKGWDDCKEEGRYICGYGAIWYNFEYPLIQRILNFRLKTGILHPKFFA